MSNYQQVEQSNTAGIFILTDTTTAFCMDKSTNARKTLSICLFWPRHHNNVIGRTFIGMVGASYYF